MHAPSPPLQCSGHGGRGARRLSSGQSARGPGRPRSLAPRLPRTRARAGRARLLGQPGLIFHFGQLR
eukprot:5723907-Pyramimonas_sp.AAC.1